MAHPSMMARRRGFGGPFWPPVLPDLAEKFQGSRFPKTRREA
jgi:hypothetical protein